MRKELENDIIEKRIQMAGKRARMEAEIKGTYVVYMDENDVLLKEYANSKRIEKIED